MIFYKYIFEGILEVPSGKKVTELPQSHFDKLVKRKGSSKVVRALTNLQNWFKYKNPRLSRWAKRTKDNLDIKEERLL